MQKITKMLYLGIGGFFKFILSITKVISTAQINKT